MEVRRPGADLRQLGEALQKNPGKRASTYPADSRRVDRRSRNAAEGRCVVSIRDRALGEGDGMAGVGREGQCEAARS